MANRFTADPLVDITLNHHVKKGYATTDGVDIMSSGTRARAHARVGHT